MHAPCSRRVTICELNEGGKPEVMKVSLRIYFGGTHELVLVQRNLNQNHWKPELEHTMIEFWSSQQTTLYKGNTSALIVVPISTPK